MVTDALLDEALELGSLVLPEVPGLARFLDLPGMVVRSSEIPFPLVNLAARLRLDESTADAALDRLAAHFRERGVPFGVMVGDTATPRDLGARLEARGLGIYKRCEALALTDLGAPVPRSADVVVKRIDASERDAFDRVKAESFGMPQAVATRIGDLLFGGAGERVLYHLAFVDGAPAGFAQTFLHGEIAILGGAGVVPSARGRGVFRSLLAERFALARAMGAKAATIQSYEDTSAPIVKRLGFVKRGELRLFAWAAGD